ncbi:hypothetical protein A2635_02360 [Candidatus Peribacteria bacterium RIFCSPHIGHO2_01_FULL_51_9]|nr:MAG: hypothetical protein A2635_02360 [Candidatus Peribacteria bacterium RIFCSPHIGHO2_01_FULL_51_9]
MDWTVTVPGRLDAFITSQDASFTRSRIQKEIDHGNVSVNGKHVTKASLRLKSGDRVSLDTDTASIPKESPIEPRDLHLTVLYEDDSCLVIDKPAGISVHPGAGMSPGETTILNGVAFLFQGRAILFSPESVLVHRLDKDTTGCLLIAKNPQAHVFYQEQFAKRSIEKVYLALVAGVPKVSEAIIDAPIGRSLMQKVKMSVFRTRESREARTRYLVLQSKDLVSLVECRPETGRTHQIRLHLSSLGHPILGDETYGSAQSHTLSEKYKVKRMCLHAWKLRFQSFVIQEELNAQSDIAKDFLGVLENVGLERV